jgi:hypothetical protein
VKKLWETEYKNREVASLIYTGPTEEPDEYDLFARDLDVTKSMMSQDEYEDFVTDKPKQITGTVLAWWLKDAHRKQYPCLSQMAIDILSIPAMSAEVERVFSGARRTISWERSQIGGSNIMKTECLKSWFQSHITKGKAVAVVDELLSACDYGDEVSGEV